MMDKRKRGRPVGSSRKNEGDFQLLKRIAERILHEPSLKPTTALKAVGITNEADLRRLRDKWSGVEKRYIAEARARRFAKEHADFLAVMRDIQGKGATVATVLNAVMERADFAIRRWAKENQSTSEGMSALSRALEAHRPNR